MSMMLLLETSPAKGLPYEVLVGVLLRDPLLVDRREEPVVKPLAGEHRGIGQEHIALPSGF